MSEAFVSVAWTGWLAWPAGAMLVSLCVDRAFGEPPVRWHPVVAMGRYLAWFGPRLWTLPQMAARLGGAMAWCLGALLVLIVALMLDVGLRALLPGGLGELASVSMLAIATGLLLKPMLAWRLLRDEVVAVEADLAHSLPAGRERLARLVSRPVDTLDETQVRESAIETLAENLNDSVVAPLFWFAVAGLPGAALYRFANTADAMWGYKDHRRWMGGWAARVDDVLSWLPARLTALLLSAAACRWPGWRAMRHEASLTPSPNGGWPMGTMALLLGARLNKPDAYALNAEGRAVSPDDTPQALRWCERTVWLAWACLVGLSGLMGWVMGGGGHA